MAERNRKQHRTTGEGKRNNPADPAGTDGAKEGQSPTKNSTNTASHATRAAKKAKQKQIAATKQAETTLVLATPTTVERSWMSPRGGGVNRSFKIITV